MYAAWVDTASRRASVDLPTPDVPMTAIRMRVLPVVQEGA